MTVGPCRGDEQPLTPLLGFVGILLHFLGVLLDFVGVCCVLLPFVGVLLHFLQVLLCFCCGFWKEARRFPLLLSQVRRTLRVTGTVNFSPLPGWICWGSS